MTLPRAGFPALRYPEPTPAGWVIERDPAGGAVVGQGRSWWSARRLAAVAVGAIVVGAGVPLIGASGTASAAPKSKAPAPAVSSFTASPSALAASGGTVVLRDLVTGATSCSVSSTPALAGLPATLPCASGTRTVVVPANTGSKTEKYKLTLSATGSKTVKAKATLTVAAAPAAPGAGTVCGQVMARSQTSRFSLMETAMATQHHRPDLISLCRTGTATPKLTARVLQVPVNT